MQTKRRKKLIIYVRLLEQYFLLEKQIIKKKNYKTNLKSEINFRQRDLTSKDHGGIYQYNIPDLHMVK